jgi:signal transduction histidine kinase
MAGDGREGTRLRDLAEAARGTDPGTLMVADRLAALGTLVAGVAHEINNPITYVLGNLGELERICQAMREALIGYRVALERSGGAYAARCDEFEAKIEEAGGAELLDELFADAIDGARRIRDVVSDLLRLSHPSERTTTPVDVHEILDSTLRLVGQKLATAARLERDYGATRRIEADRAKLGQVFLNLVTNAIDACQPPDPTRHVVRVSTADTEDGVKISVSDSGHGVPEYLREKIFEAFYTSKPIGAGTGLGLFISRRIVTEHGGRLEVESDPGKGARFTLWLPERHGD